MVESRFRAVTAPFNWHTPKAEVEEYFDICHRRDVLIAEIGVWKNLFDPDPARAAEAMDYAMGQLALADEAGIPCCVNIAGAASEETYARIVESIRAILDKVKPKQAFYCLEPMPWMVPDSPDAYLTLIKDTRMYPTRLTVLLEECSPGEGTLDYAEVLRIMDRHLSADAPVLLEHMTTFEEYRIAYDYVAVQAQRAGIAI